MVLRVVAYAAVMTPEYPPFRLDPGESELAGSISVPGGAPAEAEQPFSPPTTSPQTRRWGFGRITGLVAASILALIGLGLMAAGGTAIVLDQTQRDSSRYLMTSAKPYSTPTYAVESASYRGGTANDWFVPSDILGTVRLTVHSAEPVFIGIARETDLSSYLAGVARAEASSFTAPNADLHVFRGGAPSSPPGDQRFWAARAAGSGTQTLTWEPRRGNWRIVLMNAGAARGVRAEVSIGARFPNLLTMGAYVLGLGILALLVGGGGIYLATRQTPLWVGRRTG